MAGAGGRIPQKGTFAASPTVRVRGEGNLNRDVDFWRLDTDVQRTEDKVTWGLRSCECVWHWEHPLLPGPEFLKRNLQKFTLERPLYERKMRFMQQLRGCLFLY